MKNRKLMILVIVLALLLLAAWLAYRALAPRYVPTELPEEESAAVDEIEGVENGMLIAPDFTVLDGEENELRLSDLRGQPVIINFWATWCPPCRAELPYFDAAYAEFGDEIVFLMIDVTDGVRDTQEAVSAFLEEEGYSFPVYYDTQLSAAMAYGVSSIPMTVLISGDGYATDWHLGAMSEETLNALLNKLS